MAFDFLAGCMGGCAGVLVGHPLDTIKVHLQTQDPRNPKYRGIWHCMETIVAKDKVRGLYRGISSPMAGIGMVNAIVFGVYGNVQRLADNPDSLRSHFLAGSVAGLMQSVVCAPMELAKTRIQLQQDMGNGVQHKGPLQCLKHIIRTEGIRGTFRGFTMTTLRDIPGFSSYFVSYEFMMRQTPSPNAMYSLLAGGFAGIFSWLCCYPIDVVKTCLQADGLSTQRKYTGSIDCMRKGYQADGLRFFCRGLTSTLIRAFPMNAACFFVVSSMMRMTKTDVNIVVHPTESIAMVDVDVIYPKPLPHLRHSMHRDEETDRKRFFMIKSLKALGAFNEAVCQTEVEELANEFYPDSSHKYYIFEDERLYIANKTESKD